MWKRIPIASPNFEVTNELIAILIFIAISVLMVLYLACRLFLKIEAIVTKAERRKRDVARRHRGFEVKLTTGEPPVPQNKN